MKTQRQNQHLMMRSPYWWVFVATTAIAGVLLILLATSRNGPGISPDSVNYIAAARDFLNDGDMRDLRYGSVPHRDLILWPPLFPFVIALFSFGPGDFTDAARLVNAVTYGATIAVAGIWLHRIGMSVILRVPALIAILLAYPLYGVAIYAWSEPLFSFWLLVTSLWLAIYWRDGKRKSLAIAAGCAALAALSRYVGLSVIAGGGLIVLMRGSKPFVTRMIDGVIFGLISGTPIGLWMLRNELIAGTATGPRGGPIKAPWDEIRQTPVIIGRWFSPQWVPEAWHGRVAILMLAMVIAVVAMAVGRNNTRKPIIVAPEVITLMVLTVVYLIEIPYSIANYSGDPLSSRFLSPIAVPLLLLVFTAIAALRDQIVSALSVRQGIVVDGVVIALLGCWLLAPLSQIQTSVDRARARGVGQYASNSWVHSDLMQYLRETPPNGKLVSNYSEAIVFLTEFESYSVGGRSFPKRLQELVPIVESGPTYLVWVTKYGERTNRASLEEVQAVFDLTPFYENDEGAIYLMTTKPAQ